MLFWEALTYIVTLEHVGAAWVAEFAQGFRLNLADAFPRYFKLPPNLLQSAALPVFQSKS